MKFELHISNRQKPQVHLMSPFFAFQHNARISRLRSCNSFEIAQKTQRNNAKQRADGIILAKQYMQQKRREESLSNVQMYFTLN